MSETKKTVSAADKRIITVLAVLNVTVLAFIAVYNLFILQYDKPSAADSAAADLSALSGETALQAEQSADFRGSQPVSAFAQPLVPSYSDVQLPAGIRDEFIGLYSVNRDTAAWLRIEGTNVDHVVLKDVNGNTLKYDRATFYGDYYLGGSLYMDCRNRLGNTADGLSKNTIIYGHYLEHGKYGGGMFTDLKEYADIEYYRAHPIIELDTLYGSYKFKVMAAYIAADSTSKDNSLFYFWNTDFSDGGTLGYAEECARRSYIRTEKAVDVLPDDKFITLVTCSHECDTYDSAAGKNIVNVRFVVVGRLIRDGESEEVNTELVYKNSNPRMPQLWYDLRGLSNPFAGVPIWRDN